MAEVGPLTALSLAKCSRKLSSLDISWYRRTSNKALGLIVDSCSSLKLLKIFHCSSMITTRFFEGHSNPVVGIMGVELYYDSGSSRSVLNPRSCSCGLHRRLICRERGMQHA
ncbi:hypothetical protein OROGR_007476 [Orobanche gracilis]